MALKIKMEPPIVGDFIKTEILETNGLEVTATAAILQVSRPALSRFLNGHSNLLPEMAIRLEKAFGLSAETLMKMQNARDFWLASQKKDKIHIKPWKKWFQPDSA